MRHGPRRAHPTADPVVPPGSGKPDAAALLAALEGAAARFVQLAARVTDASSPVPRSTWTTGDLVAHVTRGLEAYVEYLAGGADALVDVTDIAGGTLTASNAVRLDEEQERTIEVLRRRAEVAAAALVSAAAGRALDEPVFWHGRREPLRALLASSLAEQLIHGLDLARSIGAPWEISRRDALLVIEHIAPLLPLLVNPKSTATLHASIVIRLRGGNAITLTFAAGDLTVDGPANRADATISADPLAFLLVAYGRSNQWAQIARGRLIAWGRKPWHALRLVDYLVHP
jgi:uncharacterized protein (TIGR03083 family)